MTVRGDGRRPARVAERIREQLARSLERDVSDPRLRGVIVSSVEVTGDLQVARIRVRLTHGDSPDARKQVTRGLQSATARLRRAVGSSLGLRRTPELRFAFDEGADAQARIEQLLAEIQDDED